MTSVLNFFKKKIKPFKKSNEKSTIFLNDQTLNRQQCEKEPICNLTSTCVPKRIQHTDGIAQNFKAKKRIAKNVLTSLKLIKKSANITSIEDYITSDIVIVSNPSSPLVNSTKFNLNDNVNTISLTPEMSVTSSGCGSTFFKTNSIDSSTHQTGSFDHSNDWTMSNTGNMLNASSKNYFYNEAESIENNFDSNLNQNEISLSNSIEMKNEDSEPVNFSFSRAKVTKRKQPPLNLTSSSRLQTNLDRSLSIDELTEESVERPSRVTNTSKRKCRRSNTTVANSGHKSNSIIDYFNKLELINPVRKKEFKLSETLSKNIEKIDEIDKSISSQLNNTTNKNDIEKIQDLFFDDGDTSDTEELTNFAKKTEVISSYMDSPVSTNGMSPSLTLSNNKSDDYYHVPSSSSPATDLIDDTKSNSHIINQSIEKLRRSISTPGLKEINTSIFSNISSIQIRECCYELVDTDLNNNNKEIELSEKSMETNEIERPQFIRGGKTRSSKNIKQLFKNVVKYQMNALNSLEKFYESQLNKLEADRKQNLKLNPHLADKINEFYDRQLGLLEERVQSNLTLICENKRNRLSTASSSSTIQQNQCELVSTGIHVKSNEYQNRFTNNDKMAKIVAFNHFKQTQTETTLKSNVNSRTLNDLKLNLKNQNNLLPSKSNYNKTACQSLIHDSSTFESPVKSANKCIDLKQYSIARYRSPKQQVNRQLAPTLMNQFYKKQSILQSPIINETPKKENQSIKPTQFQYQKNRIKRYSTSNENLAQITKVHHVRNNMARIVRLNKMDQQHLNNVSLAQRHFFKKHQSVCSLDSNEISSESIVVDAKIFNNEYGVKRHGYVAENEFRSVNHHDVFNFFEINGDLNQPHQQPRLSDSHLLYEMRQQHHLYQKKCSKSILIETKV